MCNEKSTSDRKTAIMQEKIVVYKHDVYNDDDDYGESDERMKYPYNNYRYESNDDDDDDDDNEFSDDSDNDEYQ